MDIKQNNKQKLRPLEGVCSALLFLSLVLNDSLGDVVGLNVLSKGAILLFMVFSLILVLFRNVKVPVVFPVLLLANVLWWWLSCVWAPGSTSFMSTLAQNVLFAFFVFCFFLQAKNYDLLFWAMFFSGILLIVFSLSVYGINDFIETLQEERIGTEFTNANTYGRVFSYSILAGVYLALYKRRWWCLAGCLVFMFFSLSSGSKKAILIILIGVIILSFFRFGFRHPIQFLFWLALAVGAIAWMIHLPAFTIMYERFTDFLKGEKDAGDMLRQEMITTGLELFRAKPIAGWGLDAFGTVSRFGVYSHNNFVEILVDYGIIGFSLFYSIYFYIIGKFRYMFRKLSPSYLMMLSVLLTILITDYGIVSYGLKWNWIVIGAAAAMAVHCFSNCNKYVINKEDKSKC